MGADTRTLLVLMITYAREFIYDSILVTHWPGIS